MRVLAMLTLKCGILTTIVDSVCLLFMEAVVVMIIAFQVKLNAKVVAKKLQHPQVLYFVAVTWLLVQN